MGLPKPVADWAHRTDQAEKDWARQAVDEWARTAEFSRPFQWGEAEAAVLARDYPPLPGSMVWRMFGIVGWGVLVLLAVPLLGAAVVGFVLVAIGCAQDGADAARDWFSAAMFPFAIAVIVVLTYLRQWWQSRRRSLLALVINGTTALASAAAFVVLAISSATAESWLPVLILAAAVLGAVSLVLGLVSKPEGSGKSRKPPLRGPRNSAERDRALRARKRMLEILVHRGLVDLDEGDRIRVAEMPLGYWSELDGIDERERRRVLELRHVGWRDFDSET